MANAQTLIGHPKTVAEIRQTRLALFERERALQNEGAANYAAMKAGSPPSRPLSDHERRVGSHIQLMMNGSTPPQLLVGAVSRDDQIRAELDAIAYVDRELGRQQEVAQLREAQQLASEMDKPWRALCREIVLASVKLASLEQRAREMLEPIASSYVNIAMGRTIGSGSSILGIGDPLIELKEDALKCGVVTAGELRKAENV